MQQLVTAEQIRKYEASFIEKNGNGFSLNLMEKAGLGLANVIKDFKEPYLIICGKGNNGGDGLVAARYLHAQSKKVFIILTTEEHLLSNDAKINFNKIKDTIQHLKIQNINDEELYKLINDSNTIVDCLLGTGVNKPLPDLFNWIIKTVNNSKKDIVACDIPTGLDPDTGNVGLCTIKAKTTVTFAYPKIGLMIYPGKKYAGSVKVIDIGLPQINSDCFLLDDDFICSNLPRRQDDSNKGTFGKTLLVCGSSKYPGAALLASRAASSIGSGLTALSSVKEVFEQITPAIPEVTHVDFSIEEIIQESVKSQALVIGPGLTCTKEIEELVVSLIKGVNIPIVLDADGINVLAGKKSLIQDCRNQIVLTPHPKELARLLGISTNEILDNKIKIAINTACDLGCTLILKGPGTIIATKDKKMYISPFANAALAKGGTGDVLAGFIGGLIAQGLMPDVASCVGVYLHGQAGELVSRDKTVFSLLPQDLITYLPQVLKTYS